MAGKRGDKVRTEYYDPQIMGKLQYANNPSQNRVRLLERFYLNQLIQMSVCRFTWNGLEEIDVPVRNLELALLHRGCAVFFHEDDVYGQYLAMRAAGLGEVNIFDDPTSYTVTGGSGKLAISKVLTLDECVPIWANYMRIPDFPNVQLWAYKLAQIDTTIELSFQNARQTKFIGVPADMRLAAENVLRQMTEGVHAVFGTPELSQIAKAIETIDLESHPSKLINLLIAKGKVWNEIMTFMGINNSNEDKKERLVSDEVHINAEQVDLVKKTQLATREEACTKINKMFGLNISVEFNQSNDVLIAGAEQGISSVPTNMDRDPAEWNR